MTQLAEYLTYQSMASPTQFRQYHIAQDAEGRNIEVTRTADQVAVLAFDAVRQIFVICHVLLDAVPNRKAFDDAVKTLQERGHVRLARVLEAGEDDGNPFYITESVDGETLQDYLGRFDKLPDWLAMRIAQQTLIAAKALMEVGNLMPANPLRALRLLQVGPQSLEVRVADYQMLESVAAKGNKLKQARSQFEKQTQFLVTWFVEQRQERTSSGDFMINVQDFSELLQGVLTACAPGMEKVLEQTLENLVKNFPPAPVTGELAATLKPKAFLTPLLATFQEIARSVVQQVRIQSQRLDAGQPYSLRGVLTKTGQPVIVEQVPPVNLTGPELAESIRQVKDLPKTGKFPNLVPVLFMQEHEGIECLAEAAVEGVSLQEVLSARGTLDVQETYLVLAGVDAALSQMEKAKLNTRRLRLEDIHLFTGFSRENPRDLGLLPQRLNEWPGFSIVLRTHPSLHALAGRGTDPGILLPLEPSTSSEAEPVWNGGWIAGLGSFLVGAYSRAASRRETGIAELDTVFRLLDDELSRAAKGTPSSRASFLARFARVMQQFDLAQFTKSGGFWTELSGSATAQGHAAEVSRAAAVLPSKKAVLHQIVPNPVASKPQPVPRPVQAAEAQQESSSIGFAEALMRQPEFGEEASPQAYSKSRLKSRHVEDEYESSWQNMQEERPFLVKVFMLVFSSMLVGATLAHLSGDALWQSSIPVLPTPPVKAEPVIETEPEIELPVATPPASSSSSRSSSSSSVTASSPAPASRVNPPAAIPVMEDDRALNDQLRNLKQSGASLPQQLQPSVKFAAESGNPEAMYALGQDLLYGHNGRVDEEAAVGWLRKAAVQNIPEAKDLLGVCYAMGKGTANNDAEAFKLFSEAYTAGVPSACGNLGAMYLRGRGVTRDLRQAATLFKEGAQRQHVESMLLYAQCLEQGNGTAQNVLEAQQWYVGAARKGNAEAARWCREKGITF